MTTPRRLHAVAWCVGISAAVVVGLLAWAAKPHLGALLAFGNLYKSYATCPSEQWTIDAEQRISLLTPLGGAVQSEQMCTANLLAGSEFEFSARTTLPLSPDNCDQIATAAAASGWEVNVEPTRWLRNLGDSVCPYALATTLGDRRLTGFVHLDEQVLRVTGR